MLFRFIVLFLWIIGHHPKMFWMTVERVATAFSVLPTNLFCSCKIKAPGLFICDPILFWDEILFSFVSSSLPNPQTTEDRI